MGVRGWRAGWLVLRDRVLKDDASTDCFEAMLRRMYSSGSSDRKNRRIGRQPPEEVQIPTKPRANTSCPETKPEIPNLAVCRNSNLDASPVMQGWPKPGEILTIKVGPSPFGAPADLPALLCCEVEKTTHHGA